MKISLTKKLSVWSYPLKHNLSKHFSFFLSPIMNSYSRWKEMLQFSTFIVSLDAIPHHRRSRCLVVITTAQFYLTKPKVRFCASSNPARGVSEIRDGEDFWQSSRLEVWLNAFRRSIIPQKQFIMDLLKLWRHSGIAHHSITQYFNYKRA